MQISRPESPVSTMPEGLRNMLREAESFTRNLLLRQRDLVEEEQAQDDGVSKQSTADSIEESKSISDSKNINDPRGSRHFYLKQPHMLKGVL